jgi:hypothetical protein
MMLHIREPEIDTESRGLMLSPFVPELWLIVLITMLLLVITLQAVWNFSVKYEARPDQNAKEHLFYSVLYVLGSFFLQGE